MRRFAISVVAEVTGMHQQTIRQYERLGLITPQRSPGGTRSYSEPDIERLLAIAQLTQQLGVNLAGVEIILRMREREGQLVQMLREMFGQLDEDTRQRYEQLLRGNRPGIVKLQLGAIAKSEREL
ncbi:MAG: MerR family transcriptional regulator [bacterium]|nr:MerR family transcriptional regulator [bacterium]